MMTHPRAHVIERFGLYGVRAQADRFAVYNRASGRVVSWRKDADAAKQIARKLNGALADA